MAAITHPTIRDGWFREINNDMWPGQALTLRVNQVVHHERSAFQDVLIFESSHHGMVLVLDNAIQCTERDEFSYQEMITHLAMFAHPAPRRVLVIGGGDGGVLREVVKHECVERAVLVDIDEAVIRLSKKFLPAMSVGFQHPKVETHVADGVDFLRDRRDEFDVIITDSGDPAGPAETLFQHSYFELLHGALRDGGIIATQGASPRPPPPPPNTLLTYPPQPRTPGCTCTSSSRCKRRAAPSSPSRTSPGPPSPRTPAARSASWCAPRMRRATCASPSAGCRPTRRTASSATTRARSTRRRLSCPSGWRRRCGRDAWVAGGEGGVVRR